ncbi:High-affinity branched-chain amino acid transport system permease protein LivH [compost metagenome]
MLVYIIITLGTHMVIQGVALSFWGPEAFAVEPLSKGVATIEPISLSYQSLLIVGATGALFAALFAYFVFTLRGKALRASSVNRAGARLCGIRVERAGRTAFFVATGLAAAAGILIAPVIGVHYEMGFLVGLKGFVGATLGGLISYPGAVAGGLLVGLLESAFSFGMSAYRDALVFMMIVPILILRTALQLRKGLGANHDH